MSGTVTTSTANTWRQSLPFFAPYRGHPYSGDFDLPGLDFKVMWADPLVEGQLPARSRFCPMSKRGMCRSTGALRPFPFPCMSKNCGHCMVEKAGTQLGWLEHLFQQNRVCKPDPSTGQKHETPFLHLIWYCEQPFSVQWLDTLRYRRKDRGGNYRWVQRPHPTDPVRFPDGILHVFADRDMQANGAPDRWSGHGMQQAMIWARWALRIPGILRVDGVRKWAPKPPKQPAKFWAIESSKMDLEAGYERFREVLQWKLGGQLEETGDMMAPLPEDYLAARPVSWFRDELKTCLTDVKTEREAQMEWEERQKTQQFGFGEQQRAEVGQQQLL